MVLSIRKYPKVCSSYGIQPDLATYAKALGNGYPIAALGGKRAIMSLIGQGVAQGARSTIISPEWLRRMPP